MAWETENLQDLFGEQEKNNTQGTANARQIWGGGGREEGGFLMSL